MSPVQNSPHLPPLASWTRFKFCHLVTPTTKTSSQLDFCSRTHVIKCGSQVGAAVDLIKSNQTIKFVALH